LAIAWIRFGPAAETAEIDRERDLDRHLVSFNIYKSKFFQLLYKFFKTDSICEKSPDWSNFFEEISPQFLHLNANPMTLRLDSLAVRTDGVVAPKYKVRIMELLADNIGRADILMMKKPPGFSCCPLCKITVIFSFVSILFLFTGRMECTSENSVVYRQSC
jgi:hypothetical protein